MSPPMKEKKMGGAEGPVGLASPTAFPTSLHSLSGVASLGGLSPPTGLHSLPGVAMLHFF
jgi:hypothetical protein